MHAEERPEGQPGTLKIGRLASRRISRTPCLVFNSDESGDDMILRRTLEGAEKCALRDLRRLLDTEVEYFIVPHYERAGVCVSAGLKTFRVMRVASEKLRKSCHVKHSCLVFSPNMRHTS